mgnify:FL=1
MARAIGIPMKKNRSVKNVCVSAVQKLLKKVFVDQKMNLKIPLNPLTTIFYWAAGYFSESSAAPYF